MPASEVKALAESARQNDESLWKLLLREGKITEEWLAEVYARQLSIPLLSLPAQSIQPEVIDRIPEKLARRYECMPLSCDGQFLKLTMVDPSDLDAIEAIETFTGCQVQLMVGQRSEVLAAIDKHFCRTRAIDVIAEAGEPAEVQALPLRQDRGVDQHVSPNASELPPVRKLVDLVLGEALKVRASDVHIEPTQDGMRIRLRVDGVLRDFLRTPRWLHPGFAERLKTIGNLNPAERQMPQEGRFKVCLHDKATEVRISTLPTHSGEKVVLQFLGLSDGVPLLQDLGLPASATETVMDAVQQPQGMIVVSGPGGSGRSTTLYSLLDRRRSSEESIVTLDDPIEYQLDGITQVNARSESTYAGFLRSILTQDSDVVLVGEIRDRETSEITFHAAMTGHMVLTTLHANNSLATVLRLLDLGVDPFAITSSVTLMIAQRLARRICDQCRGPYSPAAPTLSKIKWDEPTFAYTRGHGCRACHGTGFRGRIGIFEILKMTPAVRKAINERASEMELRRAAMRAGFVPLMADARDKIRRGMTTAEEILRVIQTGDDTGAPCVRCGEPVPMEGERCPNCVEMAELNCLKCGQQLSVDWRVCPRCNTPTLRDWPLVEELPRTDVRASGWRAKLDREIVH